MDERGLAFYVLFGVVVAALLFGIFIVHYSRQLEARVDEQAQALADDLARISFSAFSQQQPSLDLPASLAGSEYELNVDNNISAFIVRITGGRQSGKSYYSVASVTLKVEDSAFTPGGKVYFQRKVDNMFVSYVAVSSSQIKAAGENFESPATETPPEFYKLENNKVYAKVATAIAAAYFSVRENFVRENKPIKDENNNSLDVLGYENGENVLVQIGYRGGDNIFGVKVSFEYENYEDTENIGKVVNAWIVADLTIENNLDNATACPSVENAHDNGWLYSPTEVLAYLRSRTWQRTVDDLIVVVPAYALENTRAAAATTNVSTYPTYCVTFDDYVIYYRAMPWYWKEDQPGFVYQSKPWLEPVT